MSNGVLPTDLHKETDGTKNVFSTSRIRQEDSHRLLTKMLAIQHVTAAWSDIETLSAGGERGKIPRTRRDFPEVKLQQPLSLFDQRVVFAANKPAQSGIISLCVTATISPVGMRCKNACTNKLRISNVHYTLERVSQSQLNASLSLNKYIAYKQRIITLNIFKALYIVFVYCNEIYV